MTRTRVLAALVMAPLAIAAVLLLPTPWMAAMAAVLFLGALWEWYRLAEVEDTTARGVLLLANLLLMVAVVWASANDPGRSLVLLKLLCVAGIVWWLLAMIWLRQFEFGSTGSGSARIFKLAAGTAAIIPAWAALGLVHAGEPAGAGWLLVALMIVWAADSGAYFAGRKFGRRKLAPRISPNKTVEGLLGGLLAGLVVALAGALLLGTPATQLWGVVLVALIAVLFSVVGDLFESLLKRQVGMKDSGNLIPGHGGLLDRVDGVIAALPVFAIGQIWLGF
ncbi:phosphatidate cytidylyltransferase [Luteimonas yindakuii]|uniref:Phosphatidate cytidylyltransferase n=1 Tax=Luteimonas yindakuii TaxID=2565782 RepID=A0A4Z1RC13_9GAMM|nr:phosphatidate cytidylyltransferase [Luteimonas yindakuii]QCU72501.1 phosphatidate cytidylyltransferase [Luteimonas yindakuii]TKS53713.1 phosphatidate cytidylyltransferase [Luteimonas yindakuii]